MAKGYDIRIDGQRKSARLRGEDHYFTGRPCKYGHFSRRLVRDGHCLECAVEQNHARRIADPNKHRQDDAARRSKHLEKIRSRTRESVKRWSQRNAEKVRAQRMKQRARRVAASGQHTGQDIAEIFKAQKGRCAYCRAKLKGYHVDHIVALASGGTNFRRNIQITCPPCNWSKSAKDPIDFARGIWKLL